MSLENLNKDPVKKIRSLDTDNKSADTSPKMTLVNTPTPGKKSIKKYLFISALASIMLLIAFIKYFYCFMIFDEKFYKSNFYSWRVKYADPLMYKDTWKFITKNKYYSNDENNAYTKFIEKMQTNQLLFTGHPEHYPRQHKNYNSHSNHDFNNDFLVFREQLCKAYDQPLSESILEGKELLTEKKMLFWVGSDEKQVKKIYDREAPNRIKDFMGAFTTFLNNLHKDKYKKTDLVGTTVSDKIVNDLERMSKAAGFDLSREYLAELPKKFGLVKPNTIENFGYSRMFYLFYLCTLDCEIDTLGGYDEEKSGELKKQKEERLRKLEKQKKNPAARIGTVSMCFTQLLSNIYEYDHGEGRKQLNGFQALLNRAFGVPDVAKKDQDQNIDALMKELNDVVEPKSSKE